MLGIIGDEGYEALRDCSNDHVSLCIYLITI